ncbi:MAG: polyphosphate kinase 1 [Chthonomonadales bacterium]|nr:polyphosphate kinase 1 [Chthonomonadales bacterium]
MPRLAPHGTGNRGPMTPRYFNREVSWLEFNSRVLEEANDPRHPLLERVKFLSIVHSNLDEFFMIRVSGLQEQVESGVLAPSDDGLTPPEQLTVIRERVIAQVRHAHATYESLRAELDTRHVCLLDRARLSPPERAAVRAYFATVVYPVLTPLAVDPGHPFPHISNLSLSLAVVIRDREGLERFARVKIPDVVPRLLPIARAYQVAGVAAPAGADTRFVWMEQVVAAHLGELFRGMHVRSSHAFRVIRDADLEIREDEAGDLLQTIEQSLVRRRFGSVAMLVVDTSMPREVRSLLTANLQVEARDVYDQPGPLGLSDLIALHGLPRPDLLDRPFTPRVPRALRRHEDVFAAVRASDVLLHHPYDSFEPVVQFVRAAANDPDVLAIKQTIYRVGSNSPIVRALAEASLKGKQVSVLVELKARFDEENNIEWARALERAGVHVVYGDIDLKTHCKVLLVVRGESGGIRRYVHLATGNYNAKTALLYTDLGLFTCDPEIADDVTALFNSLTGYSVNRRYRKLLVSPRGIRGGIMSRIRREIRHARAGGEGRLIFKTNSLTDSRCADALYAASRAGVRVDLIVRGSCCLVPGVSGMSANIGVTSVVGRFLEHDRVYYFRNGGDEEVWLGSADLMSRNLDRRVETLFPCEDPAIRGWLIGCLLPTYLGDNQRARRLRPDGSYARVVPAPGEPPLDSQQWFIHHEAPAALGEPTEPCEGTAAPGDSDDGD